MNFILSLVALFALLNATQAYSGSSAENRIPGNFGVGTGLHLIQSLAPQLSVSGTYNLRNDLQIEASYGSGSDVESEFISYAYEGDLKTKFGSLRAKYFLGNSFYLAGGLGHRTIRLNGNDIAYFSQDEMHLKSKATTLDLALGNVWTFDSGLYLGGEWLSLSLPLASSASGRNRTSAEAAQDIQRFNNDVKSTKDKLKKQASVGLATFVIGYQF